MTTLTVTLWAVECFSCGTPFGLSEDFYENRLADKKRWFCPNGHPQHFVGLSDKERLKRANARITHLGDQKDAAQRSADAYKGHFTRVKKQVERAENGVCPHCNRSFADLRRHMESKHQAELTDA